MSKTADQRTIVSPVDTEKRQEIDVQTGDTVRVVTKIPEGDGEYRLQPFEGIVLSRKHGNEPGATFTVRQEIDGIGVEKIFPLYSPRIDEITIVRRARTRRAKLYHIRDKAARQIRREMRRMVNVDISTGSGTARQEAAKTEKSEENKPETEDTEETEAGTEDSQEDADEESNQEPGQTSQEDDPSDDDDSEKTETADTDDGDQDPDEKA